MKNEWKTTALYVAAAWLLWLLSETLGDSILEFITYLLYFIALLAGAIALIVRLARSIVWKGNLLAPLAMVLAVLPLCFITEIRAGVSRAEDFLLRSARLEVVAELQEGALETNERGFADLPEGRRRLAEDGVIHAIQKDGELQAVEFYNMRAMLGPAFSTVYCIDGAAPDENLLSAGEIYDCSALGEGWYYVWYE